jgi:hypothetical protein
MGASFDKLSQLLNRPIGTTPRVLLLAATLALALTYVVPLWNLTMFAPQYPEGLRLDIYSHTLQGGHNGQDVKEINILNHYIGMRDLTNEDFTEFKWMPFVIGALGLICLRAAVHGTFGSLVDVTVLFLYFGAFSLWSFGDKLYQYGHNLAPGAAVKVGPFMPPIFGFKQIANFQVYSYPQAGTYAMAAVFAFLALAVILAWRHIRQVAAA